MRTILALGILVFGIAQSLCAEDQGTALTVGPRLSPHQNEEHQFREFLESSKNITVINPYGKVQWLGHQNGAMAGMPELDCFVEGRIENYANANFQLLLKENNDHLILEVQPMRSTPGSNEALSSRLVHLTLRTPASMTASARVMAAGNIHLMNFMRGSKQKGRPVISLQTESGKILLKDVMAKSIEVRSSLGAVYAENLIADRVVTLSARGLRYRHIKAPQIWSEHGDLVKNFEDQASMNIERVYLPRDERCLHILQYFTFR